MKLMGFEKINLVKAVVFDIDGVLTDGRVFVGPDGGILKSYCLRDADAVNELKRSGYLTACITGEDDYFTDFIRAKLAPDGFYAGCKEKLCALVDFEKKNGLGAENICYIGDGIYDIQAIKHAGIGICPADANGRVKGIADVVLDCNGGRGCLEQVAAYLCKR
jgi:YrbI family 3-deoxy-D-manno-octulosonate 8-phosphate phosphatase